MCEQNAPYLVEYLELGSNNLNKVYLKNVQKGLKWPLAYSSGSQPVVRVPLVVRKAVSGGTRQTLAFHVEISSSFC